MIFRRTKASFSVLVYGVFTALIQAHALETVIGERGWVLLWKDIKPRFILFTFYFNRRYLNKYTKVLVRKKTSMILSSIHQIQLLIVQLSSWVDAVPGRAARGAIGRE